MKKLYLTRFKVARHGTIGLFPDKGSEPIKLIKIFLISQAPFYDTDTVQESEFDWC